MLINDDECDTEYPDVLDDERGMFVDNYQPNHTSVPLRRTIGDYSRGTTACPFGQTVPLPLHNKRYRQQI